MQGKYNFIKLHKVILRSFSLFNKNGKIHDIEDIIDDGVYCLAGANGLGKTTFLNSINYGLTGIVLEPNKVMAPPSEIEKNNKLFTEKYFIGRIAKKDEKKAEIEIIFSLNEKFYRIIRNFFERDELRLLEIYSIKNNKNISLFDGKNKSPKQLNEIYKETLSKDIGFSSFDYFVFYQLYVLTFDENRRIIFWDDRASSHALAIAFNSEPNDAVKISDLIKRMETHESNARNARWQATQAKNKIEELTKKIKNNITDDNLKLEHEYKALINNFDKLEKILNDTQTEYDTLLKEQSYINSEIMHLKNEHKKLFLKYSKPRSKLLESFHIQNSINKLECCLCGSIGNQIVDSINNNIYKDKCPLCNTLINENNDTEQNEILKLIQINDNNISTKDLELENLTIEADGKKTEIDKIEFEINIIKQKINEFTDFNPDFSFKKENNQNIDSLIDQYKKQFILFDNEAKGEYKKRDNLKPIYDLLLKKVEFAYKDAEKIFVPTFKKLAKSFIGLDLNIHPKRDNKSIKLILELKNTARTNSTQLSESQRFFLDIALRMALAIYLSKKDKSATMFIDTPEGSLDIAYENRVGNMFAQYAIEYNQNIFMISNINASQLLISLAEKCGKSKMKFRRMLEWTDLSQIQKEGEALFKKVYTNIEKALNQK